MANKTGQGGEALVPYSEDTHQFNANGIIWTAADIPVNKVLVGLSYTVITTAANNSVTDSDGTTITNLPNGFSASWGASDGNTLVPLQSINPGTGGRIIVTMQVKDV